MAEVFSKSYDEAITEIQVLYEALNEAEELSNELNTQIANLQERNRLLENRLHCYGIDFDDIDDFLSAI